MFCFVVFLYCTFCVDRKYQRAWHSGKIFTNALCSGHRMWAFGRALVRHSRLSFVFRVLRNSLHAAIWDNIYPRCAQTASHNGLKTNGLTLDFSTVPFRRWRRITFICNKLCRQCRIFFGHYLCLHKSANNKGRTHRFAPTAFLRLWFCFPVLYCPYGCSLFFPASVVFVRFCGKRIVK